MTDPIPPFPKAFVFTEPLLPAFPAGEYQCTFARRGQNPSTGSLWWMLAKGQAGVMRQHSLSVENVASSHRQGQPHPSLSKGFRAYRIPLVSIPRRRISVYFLPSRPNPIYRLPIGGYGKGTGWSHAATFIVGRNVVPSSHRGQPPSLPFQRLLCLSNPFCQHSP